MELRKSFEQLVSRNREEIAQAQRIINDDEKEIILIRELIEKNSELFDKIGERKINKDNFHLFTTARWIEINWSETTPDIDGPDPALTKISTQYWFNNQGVVRQSTYWGKVGTCYWHEGDSFDNEGYWFCKWEDFQDDIPEAIITAISAGRISKKKKNIILTIYPELADILNNLK